MSWIDGHTLTAPSSTRVDTVIIGSGPAGSAVARALAQAGVDVLVVEAGPRVAASEHPASAFGAMSAHYRSMGASVTASLPPFPYVQAKMVGGSAPINGAICWRLPRDVYEAWTTADPALTDALPWEAIERATNQIEARLNVHPTDPAVAGRKNDLLALGAEALGLEHRPIRRNVRGCQGSGRCLQGCPNNAKQSPDATLLPDAVQAGATVLYGATVERILTERGRATGVEGTTASGLPFYVFAKRVVLAASAIQSPALLMASGIRRGPVGRHFQCHPGISLAGRFAEPVVAWRGATQGHEVTGLRRESLKFEALGFGPGILAGRLPGFGEELAGHLSQLDRWLEWGVAIKSPTEGRIHHRFGRTAVRWQSTRADALLFRRGMHVLSQLMFAAGAELVAPHVRGMPSTVSDPAVMDAFAKHGPIHPSAYSGAITHMFGTCRMGSDAGSTVVGTDFQHHHVRGLYVADSSVFPSNTGVNPQIAIMALATLCAEGMVG